MRKTFQKTRSINPGSDISRPPTDSRRLSVTEYEKVSLKLLASIALGVRQLVDRLNQGQEVREDYNQGLPTWHKEVGELAEKVSELTK